MNLRAAFGLGLALGAGQQLLLAKDASPPEVWALVAGAACLATFSGFLSPSPPAAAAGAVGIFVSPLAGSQIGLGPTAAAGAALAFLELWREAAPARRSGIPPAAVVPLGLGAGAWVAWSRILAILIGDPHQATHLAATSAGLGLAAGLWAADRAPLHNLLDLSRPRQEAGFLAYGAGCLGLIVLAGARFIGMNADSPNLLQWEQGSQWERAAIGAQAAVLTTLWLALLAWAWRAFLKDADATGARQGRVWGAALAATAGAFVGLAGLRTVGPAQTALALNGALMIAGAFVIGRSRMISGVLGPALALGAAAGLWAGFSSLTSSADIWTRRLDAVMPGGRLLALEEDGAEALGLYEFPTGVRVRLTDGLTQRATNSVRRSLKIMVLMKPEARRLLLPRARDADTLKEAFRLGLSVVALDPHGGYASFLRSQDLEWDSPGNEIEILRGQPRRWKGRPDAPADLVLLEVGEPSGRPAHLVRATRQALADLALRLGPSGLMGVVVTAPSSGVRGAVSLSLWDVFPHVMACALGPDILFVASRSSEPPNPKNLTETMPLLHLYDDLGFRDELARMDCGTPAKSGPAARRSLSDHWPVIP